jgi:hypothetical protein
LACDIKNNQLIKSIIAEQKQNINNLSLIIWVTAADNLELFLHIIETYSIDIISAPFYVICSADRYGDKILNYIIKLD